MRQRIVCSVIVAVALTASFPLASFAQPRTPGSSTTNQPNPALVSGRKAVTDAQAEVTKIRKDMARIKTRVRSTFETKDDWKAAKEAVKQADAEYDAARKPVLAAMRSKPAYKKLVADRDAAQEKIDAANGAGGDKLTDEELTKVTKARGDTGIALQKMEKDAEENDAKLVAAKQKKTEARAALDALESQVTDAVKTDPDWMAAQTQLDSAEQRLTQAKESLAATVKADQESRRAAADAAASSRSSGSSSGSRGGSSGGRGGYR